MNWKDRIFFTFGIIIWLTPIAAYIYTWYLSITLFLMPLINLYGFWNWLGMLLGITALGAVSTGFFFYLVGHVRTPQATYKDLKS